MQLHLLVPGSFIPCFYARGLSALYLPTLYSEQFLAGHLRQFNSAGIKAKNRHLLMAGGSRALRNHNYRKNERSGLASKALGR